MSSKRALISVSDKTGVVELGKFLVTHGYELVASGGTKTALLDAGVATKAVSDITGFPEILGGRVKTLHPNVFGGILAKRTEEHLGQLEQNNIGPVDVVVVNLYPFEQTVAQKGVTLPEAVEQIDIGGPSLVRAAAKNFNDVVILTNPGQYAAFMEQVSRDGATTFAFRKSCATAAFRLVARYNTLIAEYLEQDEESAFPESFTIQGRKVQDLRYGENPHQKAAFYSYSMDNPLGRFIQLHGKELSYNNLLDLDAALGMVRDFSEPVAVVLKHNNPCGAACADNSLQAFTDAMKTDPVSAFGGIVGLNREVDEALAEELARIFFECILAPGFTPEARERLQKKKNLRLLTYDPARTEQTHPQVRTVTGGFLLQDADNLHVDVRSASVVSKRQPTAQEWDSLEFAWRMVKHVKSNAIVFARGRQLIGVGAGQMSRVDSSELAVFKARKSGLETRGTVVGSDAFFPFRDGVDALAAAGATAVIQPGGSVRDEEVIAAADEHGLAMIFTGNRHFKH
jgi:phosphoribosylaminoimidazolecarboxamide formyltransferase/IMP cyclohydrolase